MSNQDQIQCSIDIPDDKILEWIVGSATINDVLATTQPPSTARIRRVPVKVSEKHDYYQQYFVPQAVSIGPYHFGEPKLQAVEELKPIFARKLFVNDEESLISLYKKVGEADMMTDLRNFYEENSTTKYCNKVFTKMMVLDSCFIYYFFNDVFEGRFLKGDLFTRYYDVFFNDHDMFTLYSIDYFDVIKDLLLLENQIPFKLLRVVNGFAKTYDLNKIHEFIRFMSMFSSSKSKRSLLVSILYNRNDQSSREQRYEFNLTDNNGPDHLLQLLHVRSCTAQNVKASVINFDKSYNYKSSNFPNVNKLLDVGIRFKPSDTKSLMDVKFSEGWCEFSAAVQLPRITVYPHYKVVLLNLIAYEMCLDSKHAWVTSYVCLLHSLIGYHEDVKVLKKAGVILHRFGTDDDFVNLLNEISTELVPRNSTYIEVMDRIHSHYEVWGGTSIAQLSNEYRKSPWKFISLLGASIALFLTGVQTYFTVWSRK